nr:TIGR03773 family transporter-associated surface protein [Kribbella italica]
MIRRAADGATRGHRRPGPVLRSLASALTVVPLLAGSVLVTAPASAQESSPAGSGTAAADGRVISAGHVDLGPRFVDGRWTVQLRDDTVDPAVWRPLDQVVLQAPAAAQVTVPTDPAYSFLGKPQQKVWVIPQVQRDGVVWPGWNTQDPEIEQRVDREVTWSLEGVRGPGAFTLFLNSDFGQPTTVFDSRKPLPQASGIDVGTHVHGNWTFDTAGLYQLDVAMTARLKDGSEVTDRRTLRLYAGDAAPATILAQVAEAPSPQAPGTAGQENSSGQGNDIAASNDRAANSSSSNGSSVLPVVLATGAAAIFLAGLAFLLLRRRHRTTA